MECCRVESDVLASEHWEQPCPCKWSLTRWVKSEQCSRVEQQQPVEIYAYDAPIPCARHCAWEHPCVWEHCKTFTADGEQVWVYRALLPGHLRVPPGQSCLFHLAIRKIRPDLHVCFEMADADAGKQLSVRSAFSGDFILEMREPKHNRISLGSVETVLRWQLGLTEQQNIISHEQPPVSFDVSDTQSDAHISEDESEISDFSF
ncbi:unnamed protein product [Symbiodinium sp. CCMP2592]|nr:unnamed protein product [Symbiodinium sp. CCMP2592]